MRVNRQLTFLFIAFAALCLFLYAVSDILLPFILGILVAYLLDPIIDVMEARKINRGWASALVLLIFYSCIVAIGFVTIPIIFQQIEGFINKTPQYMHQFTHDFMPLIRRKLQNISPSLADQVGDKAQEIPSNITDVISLSFDKIFHSGLWLMNILSLILITPIVSFYLLRDWDLSLAKLYSLLPQNYAPIIKRLARKVDDTISAFLHGQLTVCIGLGFIYAIILSILGLNFGFLIGFATGMLTFIPYVGFAVGGITGMLVALSQFGDDWTHLSLIAGTFVVVQGLESNFISPRIVGGKIGVHPAWLIFAMLAGGSLLGFTGVLISVPMMAVIAVLVRFAIEQYEHSSYYLRNRNTDHLQQPYEYKGEPNSILKLDTPLPPTKAAKPRRKRSEAKKRAKRRIARHKKS